MENLELAPKRRLFWREFLILFGAGVIADVILVGVSHLPTTPIAMYVFVKYNPTRPEMLAIAAAEIVVNLALIVGLGLRAAHATGFGAPILEKWLRGQPVRQQLRLVFIPALIVGLLIGLWVMVPKLPFLHPNRASHYHEGEKILNSSTGAKLNEFVKRTSGARVSSAQMMLSYLCEAVPGELTTRLFFLSGFVWILAKITRTAADAASRTLLWIAILLTIAAVAIPYLAWQSIFERLMSDALGGVSLPNDSSWLIITRLLLKLVPAGIAFGWLYVRRGLESTIIASVIASVAGYVATTFLLARLY
jgi:hypothetical protein